MNEKDLDDILAERLKSCVAAYGLPEGFAKRIKTSVRRSRRTLRLCIVLVAALTVVMGLTLGSLARAAAPHDPGRCALVAERTGSPTEKVSGWMLLGFLRDCFKRGRIGKRKEEDDGGL